MKRDLIDLEQPWGGLFRPASAYDPDSTDESNYKISSASSGNLSIVWQAPPFSRKIWQGRKAALSGSGVDLVGRDTRTLALAEGLERYCTTLFCEDQFTSATGAELGSAALDLDTLPRCSERELADPECPVSRPDKSKLMRWVKGICLFTGEVRYIPATLVYLYLKPATKAEAISIQITTGCAAHRTYEQALLGGLLEVIERDAISLTWLQRLNLPRIVVDSVPSQLAPYWEAYLSASANVECCFFDATTDMGVPTVYALQIARLDHRLRTLVTCATDLSPVRAIAKTMRDMASVRQYLHHAPEPPTEWKDFRKLTDGGSFMARPEQAHAFEFLLSGTASVTLSALERHFSSADVSTALRMTLTRVRELGMHAYAVDLSSDEATRVGMRVVRVLVPELQPFSFHHRARYLGHTRLYQAPVAAGHIAYQEQDLNPWPQPFA